MSRRANIHFFNNWDAEITNLNLTHTVNGFEQRLPARSLGVGGAAAVWTVQFETGLFAPHDYWYIEFTVIEGKHPGTWVCKDNFWCDLRVSDDNTVVLMQVSGGDQALYVSESSGQCYVSLTKKSS